MLSLAVDAGGRNEMGSGSLGYVAERSGRLDEEGVEDWSFVTIEWD